MSEHDIRAHIEVLVEMSQAAIAGDMTNAGAKQIAMVATGSALFLLGHVLSDIARIADAMESLATSEIIKNNNEELRARK